MGGYIIPISQIIQIEKRLSNLHTGHSATKCQVQDSTQVLGSRALTATLKSKMKQCTNNVWK